MNLPEIPTPFRAPAPLERAWWWSLLDADGQDVAVTEEYADQRFTNQGDAESWVGEVWRELADQGVASVVLHEHDRTVYGPMSLTA